MATAEHAIDVNVPVSTAYNQWTQFEEFPRFMQGIQEVRQLDDKRLQWRANIAGKEEAWEAEIIEQVPDQRVAWRSTSGAPNAGFVSFQSIDVNKTRVTLRLDYEPEGVLEKVGDALGIVRSRVQGDLERFKEFIESRGAETGEWRGEIHGGAVQSGSGTGASGAQAGAVTPGMAGATDYDTTPGGARTSGDVGNRGGGTTSGTTE